MPDIAARIRCSHLLVVGRYGNTGQDAFRRRYLIRAHDEKQIFRCKNTILGQHVKQGMLGEKGLGEINKVGNNFVVCIRPIARKLEAVAGFLAPAAFTAALLIDMRAPGGVAVILGVRTVGNYENLRIFKQT